MTYFIFCLFSPSERTADDLEIIYEELLHIKALSHLSTTVSTVYLHYVTILFLLLMHRLKLRLSPGEKHHIWLIRPFGPI